MFDPRYNQFVFIMTALQSNVEMGHVNEMRRILYQNYEIWPGMLSLPGSW